MKKVMIIAHFCDFGEENTNNRFNYIADMVYKTGVKVELITSSFSHRDKKQRTGESHTSYKMTLIYEPSYKKNVSIKRIFYSHKKMAINLKKYLLLSDIPDVIYCAMPSIDVAEVASEYAKSNNIPFIIDIQDLWPEAYKLVIKNDHLYNYLTRKMTKRVNIIYASADSIVAVSNQFLNRALLINKKSKENLSVYLGTDMKRFDYFADVEKGKISLNKTDQEIWIAYCGTLGHSYDLKVIFNALQHIDSSKYRFIIMGNGPLETDLKKLASRWKINAEFVGKLPYPNMCALLKQCDIAVNPIKRGARVSVINKHGDYAMAGLPVISTQEKGEYSKLLESYQCGIHCKNERDVSEAILDLINDKNKRVTLGNNSRNLAKDKFDRKKSYIEILEIINKSIK